MIDIGEKKPGGKLFIISTHIGNKDDMTLRGISALKICDAVICEERKEGAKILRDINISKDMYELNEQNEEDEAPFLISKILSGEKLALISDCGTPLFADPGDFLMKLAMQNDVDIEVIPGASSIMTALVRSGMDLNSFVYAGFLDRDPNERLKQLTQLAQERRTVCLLETPYRFNQLIEACAEIMGERNAYIGMNLTMRYETHHYGTFSELKEKFKDDKIKAEFVVIFEAAPFSYVPAKKAMGTRKVNKFDNDRPHSRDRREERSGSGERREYKPRFDDNRSGGGERREYKPRFDDNRSGSGERREFKRRDDDNRSGSGERREFKRRDDDNRSGSGERRDYKPRRDDDNRSGSGERRDYKPRRDDDNRSGSGERREYKPRRDDDNRSGNGERREYKPRRDDDNRSGGRDFKKSDKKFGDKKKFDDKPYKKRKY